MGKGRRYDQEYKDMIVELFKSGMSLAELSSEYGIAKSTINGWVKDVKEIKVDENEVMTLKEVKVGDTVTVKKLNGQGATKRRIMDMGITKGSEICVRKVAPLGDPIEITVRGYELSIRKHDAANIMVK